MRISFGFRWVLFGALAGALIASPCTVDAAVFSCDEVGIGTAAATGGGPHTFSCAGPTTVILSSPIFLANVVLDGGGELTVSGADASQVFWVYAGAVELRDLAITAGNSAGGPGGCMGVDSGSSLTLTEVTVSDCTTVQSPAHNIGGAIVNDGTLSLTDSVISGSTGSFGGAIASGFSAPTAILNLTRSAIAGNFTSFAGGGIWVYAGDLVVIDSAISGNQSFGLIIQSVVGTHTITRSTVSGNGHGIRSQAPALAISNSTVAQNAAEGVENIGVGAVSIANSTFEANAAAAVAGTASVQGTIVSGTCSGAITSLGGNVESPGSTCTFGHASDQASVAAVALNLGALGDYGGPTQTVDLIAPSVAIDAAISCPPPATDQRAVLRPQGAGCDSGAFERVVSVPEIVPVLPEIGLVVLAAAFVIPGALALRGRGRPRETRRC